MLMGIATASLGELGTLIQGVRVAAGLSKRKLAQAAEVDPAYVTNLENGKQLPALATLERLLGACGYELLIRAERVEGE
jgi:transcriptional regulator with XRE-family HTH domain